MASSQPVAAEEPPAPKDGGAENLLDDMLEEAGGEAAAPAATAAGEGSKAPAEGSAEPAAAEAGAAAGGGNKEASTAGDVAMTDKDAAPDLTSEGSKAAAAAAVEAAGGHATLSFFRGLGSNQPRILVLRAASAVCSSGAQRQMRVLQVSTAFWICVCSWQSLVWPCTVQGWVQVVPSQAHLQP